MSDIEEFCPRDGNHWREWLEENHRQKEAVWLIFYKTKSPNHNLSWSHAVDQALCYGWIDSVTPSMTDGYDCWQNALAERINGILKQEFLIYRCNTPKEMNTLTMKNDLT